MTELQKLLTIKEKKLSRTSPFVLKRCSECFHTKAESAVLDCCTNEAAVKAKSSRLIGAVCCPYWKADWSKISIKHRTAENGFESIRVKKSKRAAKVLPDGLFYDKAWNRWIGSDTTQ